MEGHDSPTFKFVRRHWDLPALTAALQGYPTTDNCDFLEAYIVLYFFMCGCRIRENDAEQMTDVAAAHAAQFDS